MTSFFIVSYSVYYVKQDNTYNKLVSIHSVDNHPKKVLLFNLEEKRIFFASAVFPLGFTTKFLL